MLDLTTARDTMSVRPRTTKHTLPSASRFWDWVRRKFAIDPERSSGVPLNTSYRNPMPASRPGQYIEPLTSPAADLAENPYWKRDTRRDYPRTLVYSQPYIGGLLSYGNAATPRIAAGETGIKALAQVTNGQLELTTVLADSDVGREILARNGGKPPLPGTGRGRTQWRYRLVEDGEQAFSEEYPVRTFR